MIYLPNLNKCIITPPHTGSRNLHEALCKLGGIYVIGQTIGGNVDHHYNKAHIEWLNTCEFYLVVRNPYDRLIGLYLHYRWHQENVLFVKPFSWPDFVYFNEFENWIFNTSITDYMKYSNVKNYKLIRFENLDADINQLIGNTIDIDQPYHGTHDVRKWYEDTSFLKYVNDKMAKEDCLNFGYELYE